MPFIDFYPHPSNFSYTEVEVFYTIQQNFVVQISYCYTDFT
jgi:hypothetical protein